MDAKTLETFSQKLNAADIKNKDFKKTAWGYSTRDVVEFLDVLSKGWERFQKNEKELTEKVRLLGEELTRWKNKEIELVKLREKAVQEAEQIRQDSARETERLFKEVEDRANGIRQKTEEWLENVIAQVEETERQKHNFMSAFRSALDSHYELLKNEEIQGEPLGAKLNHFLKSTMAQTATRN